MNKNWHDYKNLTLEEESMLQKMSANMLIVHNAVINPINDYVESLKSRKVKEKENAIKGLVSKEILIGLTNIRNEWEEIIYKSTHEYLLGQRERAKDFLDKNDDGVNLDRHQSMDISNFLVLGVITYKKTNGYIIVSDVAIDSKAKQIAKQEADSFLFKMCYKIGGLKLTSNAVIVKVVGTEPFSSTMKITDKNCSFDMFNQIVVNRSVHGNPYYQYPCVFENITINKEEYTRLSEQELKIKINSLHVL